MNQRQGDDNSSSDSDEMSSGEPDEFADFYSGQSNVRKVLFTNLPCNMTHNNHENNSRQSNK